MAAHALLVLSLPCTTLTSFLLRQANLAAAVQHLPVGWQTALRGSDPSSSTASATTVQSGFSVDGCDASNAATERVCSCCIACYLRAVVLQGQTLLCLHLDQGQMCSGRHSETFGLQRMADVLLQVFYSISLIWLIQYGHLQRPGHLNMHEITTATQNRLAQSPEAQSICCLTL